MGNPIRIIEVTCCADCPFHGKCKAWRNLTSKERVTLTISSSIPHDMMLKDCPLPLKDITNE